MSGSTSIMESSPENHLKSEKGEPSAYRTASDAQAIKIFEEAIEREAQGSMSEAVELYRKAFKLNDQVDLLYRSHKVPHAVKKQQQLRGKNTAIHLDEQKIREINVDELLDSFEALDVSFGSGKENANGTVDDDTPQLESEESPLLHLPHDIWVSILEILLINHPESWFNYSITCKKNAFLGFRSSILWMKLCNMIYPFQRYEENEQFLEARGHYTHDSDDRADVELPIPRQQDLIVPQYGHSWKTMLNTRPFIKFSGCYISVVNYYSEGGRPEFSNSWSNPVRSITYYRYLRFYPDGTCIKVLSHLVPSAVVGSFSRKNKFIIPQHENAVAGGQQQSQPPTHSQTHTHSHTHSQSQHSQHVPQGVSKSRDQPTQIYTGHWTLSSDGEVHVTITEGSVSTYDFHYFFSLKSSGPIFRYNKLLWKNYYALTKVIDDATGEREISEFTLKNEKPFLFSRVRRYHEDIVKITN